MSALFDCRKASRGAFGRKRVFENAILALMGLLTERVKQLKGLVRQIFQTEQAEVSDKQLSSEDLGCVASLELGRCAPISRLKIPRPKSVPVRPPWAPRETEPPPGQLTPCPQFWTGLRINSGNTNRPTGTRAMWVEGNWDVGLDLGSNDLRFNGGDGHGLWLEATRVVGLYYTAGKAILT